MSIGTITSPLLNEVSGLVASRALADVFWVHNDSGDSARFFAINSQGALLGTFPLAGATAADWEDIAIAPTPGGGNYLYLADIGDNAALRSTITVHRTIEPPSSTGATILASAYSSLRLKYPGGARDAESMFVDPLSGDLYILTKRQSVPELYSVPASAFEDVSQPVTMTAWGTFPEVPYFATAADISPDGRFILVRSRSANGYLYERRPGQSIADALHDAGTPFVLGAEPQGEAIGWSPDGNGFYTTSEMNNGSSAPIYSYSFTAPPLLPGDYNNDQVVDASDYAVWRNEFGAEFELPNETETPGAVTSEDYEVWKSHYGESLTGGGAVIGKAEVAPEPGSVLMAICGILVAAQTVRQP
jgi:hypothetical protein